MKLMMYSIIVTLLFLVPVSLSIAQQPAQQPMQSMQQIQDMQQRMNRMAERTHVMMQDMNRRIEQVKNEQIRNQYQMMHRFGEQMGMTLGSMRNAAERCEIMLRDRDMMRDGEMRRDMDRMRRHLSDMTDEMEEALKSMERMMRRLHEHQQE